MQARNALGKKITEVRQRRRWSDRSKGWIVELEHIRLDDGTVLYATVTEGDVEHSVELHAVKPEAVKPENG